VCVPCWKLAAKPHSVPLEGLDKSVLLGHMRSSLCRSFSLEVSSLACPGARRRPASRMVLRRLPSRKNIRRVETGRLPKSDSLVRLNRACADTCVLSECRRVHQALLGMSCKAFSVSFLLQCASAPQNTLAAHHADK